MATKEFKLPDVGEGVAEGELVSWLVEVGDTVTEDQAVAEVETDKALVEVPSPYDGTVKELHAAEGEMVPVGEVIITYEVEGEDEGDVPDEPEVDVDEEDVEDAEDAGEAR
ncbi:biotin/lipoyl-containing protein, partial [Halobium palmae]